MVKAMFEITSHKDTITVKRKLTLKKDGVLPAGVLDCEASFDLGVNLNNADGKAIVSKFASVFNGKISAKAKKQDERIEKARQQLARWLHQGESETKIRVYADTQQEEIVKDWNQFMKVDIKRVGTDALRDTLKKSPVNFDDLRLSFSNVDLQDSKMEFMTGVLDIAGRGNKGRVKTAGMATLVSGLQSLAKPITAIRGGWERNVKLLKQGADDSNTVYKNIASMRKAAAGLSARLERMKKIANASNKAAAQSAKGLDVVLEAASKHQKTARLNDHDKVVIHIQKAVSSFSSAKRASRATQISADTARLAKVLADIGKLLAEAEQISKSNTGSFMKAAMANNGANLEAQTGQASVEAALKELQLQFKMSL